MNKSNNEATRITAKLDQTTVQVKFYLDCHVVAFTISFRHVGPPLLDCCMKYDLIVQNGYHRFNFCIIKYQLGYSVFQRNIDISA